MLPLRFQDPFVRLRRRVALVIRLGCTLRPVVVTLAVIGARSIPLEAQNGLVAARITLERGSVSGGERVKGTLFVKRDATPAQPLQFTLSSSNPTLLRFATATVSAAANQESVDFELATNATVIPASVTVSASSSSPNGAQAQATLEIVPALLSRVVLVRQSMTGTVGSAIDCTVELRAPAPSGGIEVYFGPSTITPSAGVKRSTTMPDRRVRVPAGSRTTACAIRFDDLVTEFVQQYVPSQVEKDLESESRTVEQIVAINPQNSKPWVAIRDRAMALTYTMLPLRITSMSAQPAAIAVGGESVVTFTLNAAPGSERALLRAYGDGQSVSTRLLGTSCAQVASDARLDLVPGTLTYRFKVCSKLGSGPSAGNITVRVRNVDYTMPFTVRP